MPYQNDSLAETLFDGHEDRIQRLESDQQKLVAQSTEALTKIEYLSRQVEHSHQALTDTIQSSFREVVTKVEGAKDKIESVNLRIVALEEQHADSARHWAAASKFVIPGIIAVASVIATKFGEQVWTWLTR